MQVKNGDILEFKKPLRSWHAEALKEGARYIVRQDRKSVFQKMENNIWQEKILDELDEPYLVFSHNNGTYVYGVLKEFANKEFRIIGNVGEQN